MYLIALNKLNSYLYVPFTCTLVKLKLLSHLFTFYFFYFLSNLFAYKTESQFFDLFWWSMYVSTNLFKGKIFIVKMTSENDSGMKKKLFWNFTLSIMPSPYKLIKCYQFASRVINGKFFITQFLSPSQEESECVRKFKRKCFWWL